MVSNARTRLARSVTLTQTPGEGPPHQYHEVGFPRDGQMDGNRKRLDRLLEDKVRKLQSAPSSGTENPVTPSRRQLALRARPQLLQAATRQPGPAGEREAGVF